MVDLVLLRLLPYRLRRVRCVLFSRVARHDSRIVLGLRVALVLLFVCWPCARPASAEIGLLRDDLAGQLTITLDGREIVAYQYSDKYALPHYWPLRSPSGKLLTSQHPDPFPHHRSLWIADRVQAAGAPSVDFYHCWKNYRDAEQPKSGFRHFIRHQQFRVVKTDGKSATVVATLQWIVNDDQPILDETRTLHLVALDQGDYRLDLTWKLKASFGDVKFQSDKVHYAWPYVRIHPQFSGQQGGTIQNDLGQTGQAETNGKPAQWVDYSNTVDGVTEGLAVFVDSSAGPREWLTREYGTFGPRRVAELSGTQFTLRSGDTLRGQAAILIHRGNVTSGNVARHYQAYQESQR